MRIAVVATNRTRVGGLETYLEAAMHGLHAAGHRIAFLTEFDNFDGREPIRIPEDAPFWCISGTAVPAALRAMREWRPDVIYAHGLSDPALEAAMQGIAPVVFFAHAYYGACISGDKTTRFPRIQPCGRRFGWPCLLHFYPHRCGGLSPRTMWSDFARQLERRELMRNYRVTITASEHMRAEFLRQGLPPQTVKVIPLPVTIPGPAATREGDLSSTDARRNESVPWRLLFVGRMEALKGAGVLLDAAARVADLLAHPIRVKLVGDGRDRAKLEAKATRLCRSHPSRLETIFDGWLGPERLAAAYRDCDLLVMPSVWPEPFGMVGIEAGMYSIPVAAFAVGGIPEWLHEGVNGHLASGQTPAAVSLADAIVRCLRDRDEYQRLRIGARKIAEQFTLANHIGELVHLFESVLEPSRIPDRAAFESVVVPEAHR